MTLTRAFLTAAVLGLCLGCEDKPKETKAADLDAGKGSALDPKLAEAVAAAGSKGAKPGAGAATDDGPPPNGIFEAGKADAQLEHGKPPKIVLGEAGAEPRAVLTGTIPPGYKQSGTFEVTLRLGRAQLPALAVSLSIEAPKPKAPAPAGAAPAAAPAPPSDTTPIGAKITEVKLTGDVGPQGKDLGAQLSRMKGSKIDFSVVGGGVGVDFTQQLAKGATPELDMVLRAVAESLEATAIGFPKEPVGPGGYWLITTRGNAGGAEVIGYRLVKLEKVDGDNLTLSVSTKRYSVSHKVEIPGIPPGAELDQFQSTTEAKLVLKKGEAIARSGTSKQTLAAGLIPAGGGDQRLGIQSIADVTIAIGQK
ncbi:MAG: hypothetical protein HYZ29_05285 [Myxococcales bacterium]|nr:hypothetical protein [Myxococcales bacterium]